MTHELLLSVIIHFSFSSYLNLFQGVTQRLILEPLLFTIFLCDLFLFVEEVDIMCYADDTTPYVCSQNVYVILEILKEVGEILFEWFSDNFFKTNADKNAISFSLKINPFQLIQIMRSLKIVTIKKLLGDNLNERVGFDTYVTNICNRVSKKLQALARIS